MAQRNAGNRERQLRDRIEECRRERRDFGNEHFYEVRRLDGRAYLELQQSDLEALSRADITDLVRQALWARFESEVVPKHDPRMGIVLEAWQRHVEELSLAHYREKASRKGIRTEGERDDRPRGAGNKSRAWWSGTALDRPFFGSRAETLGEALDQWFDQVRKKWPEADGGRFLSLLADIATAWNLGRPEKTPSRKDIEAIRRAAETCRELLSLSLFESPHPAKESRKRGFYEVLNPALMTGDFDRWPFWQLPGMLMSYADYLDRVRSIQTNLSKNDPFAEAQFYGLVLFCRGRVPLRLLSEVLRALIGGLDDRALEQRIQRAKRKYRQMKG